jgi:ribosomal protein L40E
MTNQLDQNHEKKRTVLRKIGMVLVTIGGVFTIIGIGSFFASFGGGGFPKYFWCAFVGLPMLGIGKMLLTMGYMGTIARYSAGEMAPVGKDTFNYMAHGTRDGVRTMASALGEGLSAGMHAGPSGQSGVTVRCSKCNELNEDDANFCHHCGTALKKTVLCPHCQEKNDPDARFCDNCGKPLS